MNQSPQHEPSDDHLPVDGQTTEFGSAVEGADGSGSIDFDLRAPPPIQPADAELEDGEDLPEHVGDYRVERLIGSGGMGRVYLAEHRTMQRPVALKTLLPERMRQQSAVNRFYAEVRAAARLLHPNIVTAFDAGFADGVHYLAMEYVDGPTLSQLVGSSGPLAISDAVAAIRDAARGLEYAHAAGIVHRDIKPNNLMRAADGTVKVVDLGLAAVGVTASGGRAPAPRSDAGRLIGTVAFMSPEQLESPDDVDARTDIYSLGATFYYLLTGRPPYGGEFLDTVRGHRHDPLPELFAVRPDADLRLEHVLHRMMAKKPQDRYGSLLEMIADLAIHDSSETVPAWISELGGKAPGYDSSTHHSQSTHGEVPQVLGIDFGMFYASTAMAEPSGTVEPLNMQGSGKPYCRIAVADGDPPLFGDEAAVQRAARPGTVMHCLPLFVGQARLEHVVAGRRCPAEVLIGLQLRHLLHDCWPSRGLPRAVAITVPSSYDQLHRQAMLQAAAVAGLRSVRLIDRSLAALQSWHLDLAQRTAAAESHAGRQERIDRHESFEVEDAVQRPHVVISVTGNATEVVVARRRGPRPQQLATIGQWHYGMLQWQQKLVDLAAALCRKRFSIDPLATLESASALQLACERALPRFLLAETVTVQLAVKQRQLAIELHRAAWLEACEPLMAELLEMVSLALKKANIDPTRVSHCLLQGLPTRLAVNRRRIAERLHGGVQWVTIDRGDVARGAAACVAGELPGRGDIPLPPQPATCHDLGLLVIDSKGRRRIRTVIPRGTILPARTSRRIAPGAIGSQSLMLVESSTWRENAWRSLGAHRIGIEQDNANIELTFEVNMDGVLAIRRREPQTGHIQALPPRPQPTLDREALEQWAEWVAELLPAPKRAATGGL